MEIILEFYTPFIFSTTSIAEQNIESIEFYPNRAHNYIIVDSSFKKEIEV